MGFKKWTGVCQVNTVRHDRKELETEHGTSKGKEIGDCSGDM